MTLLFSKDMMDLIPSESTLSIANETRMTINLEGCVNTLSYECRDFFSQYSKDGRNRTAKGNK